MYNSENECEAFISLLSTHVEVTYMYNSENEREAFILSNLYSSREHSHVELISDLNTEMNALRSSL